MQLHGYGTAKAPTSAVTGLQLNMHSGTVLGFHSFNLSVSVALLHKELESS